MKLVIVTLLNIVFVVGGILGGRTMNHPKGDAYSPNAENDTSLDEFASSADNKNDDFYPIKFSRPFIIPVTDGWRTRSLVVLTLSVEVEKTIADQTIAIEEKLRDRIITALVAYSHRGGFSGPPNDPALYEAVKEETRQAVEEMFPRQAGDVLVMELLKRSV